MNTIEFQELGLESFHQEMAAQADRFKTVLALQNKLFFGRGINQTLAMECENLQPGFITTSNPIGSFSIQPSKTNYSLALEELSHLQMAGIGALVGLALALVWKIVKWFKKWRGGGDEGSTGGGGSGGSEAGGYMPPKRADVVISGSIDVIASIDGIKKDLVAASLKSGSVSRTEATTQLDDILAANYKGVAKNTSQLFDDFITGTGPVAVLMKLHEGVLKEAPTKIRDVFNQLEQIINTFTSSSDQAARIAEVTKLDTLRATNSATKSFWYTGEIAETSTCSTLTAKLQSDINDTRRKDSTLAKELSNRTSDFTTKLRQGLHVTYEKLDVDTARLASEVETDLQSKLTSLSKVIARDKSHQSAGDSNDEYVKDFASYSNEIIRMLGSDIAAVANLIHASEMVCKDYAGVIAMLPLANRSIIAEFTAVAKKNRATDMMVELGKLKISNDKLVKNR